MPFSTLPTLPTFGRAARHLDRDLTPQEEEEINRSLVQRGISGLTGAANILDIPGSMIRDVLALENPLDQLLPWNWTTQEGRTSGQELFGFDRDESGWTPGLTGFASEVLLDPLTYLSFGASAATKAGQVLKHAGKFDDVSKIATRKMAAQAGKRVDDVARVGARQARSTTTPFDMMRYSDEVVEAANPSAAAAAVMSQRGQLGEAAEAVGQNLDDILYDPVGSFARFKVPGLPALHMGAPPIPFTGRKADVVLDAFGNHLKYKTAAGRALNQLFRPSVMDTTTEAFQRDIAPALYDKKVQAEVLGREAGSEMDTVLSRNLEDLELVHDFERPLHEVRAGLEEGIPIEGDWVTGGGLPANAKVLKIEDTGEAWVRYTDPDTGALMTKGFDKEALKSLKRDTDRALMSHPDVVTATYKLMEMPEERLLELGVSEETFHMVDSVRRTLGAMKGEADEWGADFAELYGHEYAVSAARRAKAEKALEAAEAMPGVIREPGTREGLLPWDSLEAIDKQQAIESAQKALDDLGEPFVAPEEYFARMVAREGGDAARTRGPMFAADPHNPARLAFTRGFTDSGTGAIREMTQDPKLSRLLETGDIEGAAQHIGDRWGHLADEMFEDEKITRILTDPSTGEAIVETVEGVTKSNRWDSLAQWLREMSTGRPEMMQAGIYVDPVSALTRRVSTFNDYIESTKAAVRTLAAKATPTASEGSKTVRQLVKELKLKSTRFIKETGEGAEVYQKIAKLMGRHVDDPKEMSKVIREIASMHLPADMADDLTRFHQSFRSPEVVGEIAKQFDNATNMIKGMLTAPWLAFHTRNGVSGQIRNWVAGLVDLKRMPGALRTARHVARGGVMEGASSLPFVRKMHADRVARGVDTRVLDDEVATDLVRELYYTQSPKRQMGEVFERAGAVADVDPSTGEALTEGIGGKYVGGIGGTDKPATISEMIGTWFGLGNKVPEASGPLNVRSMLTDQRGVSGRAVSGYGPSAAGEMLGQYVEDLNRLTPFIEQLRLGVDPAAAMKRINAAQVDYSAKAYTSFERQVAQRLFPFWKFSSRQMPFVIKELAERPGGRLAKVMRGTRHMKGPQTRPLPEYLQQSMAVEMPEAMRGPEGDPRYLTTLDLMSMDPFTFMPTTAGEALTNPLMETASRLNPMLKFLGETATGQTFFQKGPMGGRPLTALDPVMGRTMANIGDMLTGQRTREVDPFISQTFEHAMLNSPFSRFLTTGRTLTDPRKGLLGTAMNLGTGFRVSDLPPRTQEALLREAAEEAILEIPGGKTFRNVYLPEDLLATMSPAEREHAERLRDLKRMLAKRAKERAEAARMAQL